MRNCSCPTDRLCDQCVADTFAQLAGVAACRGENWAESVSHTVPRSQPWPSSPRATAIALRKVADLSQDERLRSRLAAEVERWAARRWAEPLRN